MELLPHNLIAVLGATATGKTSLAVALARQLNGEVISADSRQVYRGLDIGSGKDLHEYGEVPYHLIDIVDPVDEYNLYQYQQDFYRCYAHINEHGKTPILCGGSMLYVDAVLSGYQMTAAPPDPERRKQFEKIATEQLVQRLRTLRPDLHNTTDITDRQRVIRALEICEAQQDGAETSANGWPSIHPLVFTIDWPREERSVRIKQRLKQRLSEGMIEEVQSLHESGVSWDKLNFFGLEYRFISQHLRGELTFNDMQQKLASAIIKFAKRQDTWLRKLQRKGMIIHSLDPKHNLMTQANQFIIAVDN